MSRAQQLGGGGGLFLIVTLVMTCVLATFWSININFIFQVLIFIFNGRHWVSSGKGRDLGVEEPICFHGYKSYSKMP